MKFRKFFGIEEKLTPRHHHKHLTNESSSLENVTLIIPIRDKIELLMDCLASIAAHTPIEKLHILIVDNGSTEADTLHQLALLRSSGFEVMSYPEKFNFSKICNLAASRAQTEFVCFLNNDVKVLHAGWITNMLSHFHDPRVASVGCLHERLSGEVSHSGIAIGFRGLASNVRGTDIARPRAECYEASAVSFAAVVCRLEAFNKVNGLSPEFAVGLNDVDFGLKLLGIGLKTVLCTHSQVMHEEFGTRARLSTLRGFTRAVTESVFFILKWGARHDKLLKR